VAVELFEGVLHQAEVDVGGIVVGGGGEEDGSKYDIMHSWLELPVVRACLGAWRTFVYHDSKSLVRLVVGKSSDENIMISKR
jgi:hypothetical protein